MIPSSLNNQGYPSNQVDIVDPSTSSALYPPTFQPNTPPQQLVQVTPPPPPLGINNPSAVNVNWNNLPVSTSNPGLSERILAVSRRALPTAK